VAILNVLILGYGKMGSAIFKGLKESMGVQVKISVVVRSPATVLDLKKELQSEVTTDFQTPLKTADLVIVCVKPQQAGPVFKALSRSLNAKQTVISICAGISLAKLREFVGNKASLIRAMPNTPCLISEGVTLLCADGPASNAALELSQKVFKSLGEVVVIEENLFDAATSISGCGPAYVFMMIEALSDAGVKVGLPRELATRLAAKTFQGSSQMLIERKEHPAKLKDEVTTPGGITIEALMALEEGKLRIALMKAVVAATEKSRVMGERA